MSKPQSVKFCRPVIRGLRTRDGSPYALGKWEWAARCVEHDTSWTTGPRGLWHEAWQAAVVHQWEFAEIVRQPVNRLTDDSGAGMPTEPE